MKSITRLKNPIIILPDWHGQPAQQMMASRFKGKFLPAIPSVTCFLSSDSIIGLAASDDLCKALGKELGVNWMKLSEGEFAIVPQADKRRVLVLGADKRSLLAGLARFSKMSQVDEKNTVIWSHGEIVERCAMPRSYYWTWDHATNWLLSSEGVQEWGCNNMYARTTEDFIQDFKLLVDHCVVNSIGGIAIWGFCRDSHGGVAASQEICNYADDRGIRILPGVGTSCYGGVVYSSDHPQEGSMHPLTAKRFVETHPDAGMVLKDGTRSPLYPCPTHPKTARWLAECAQWLYSTFRIGGVNLEHGDYYVCRCRRCRSGWIRQKQPGYFKTMTEAHRPFVDEAMKIAPDSWITYATYTGYAPVKFNVDWSEYGDRVATVHEYWRLGCTVAPEFAKEMDPRTLCQWTLTWMLHEKQRPLSEWLDDGKAATLRSSPHWAAKWKPPTRRNIGFFHQGSQVWVTPPHPAGMNCRYSLQLSCIKEACLHGYHDGMEGFCIEGEVSTRCIQQHLNYLALSFFARYPEASLREFGAQCLGLVLDGKKEGERFVELLVRAEAGTCTEEERAEIKKTAWHGMFPLKIRPEELARTRFWHWLQYACQPGQWDAAQVYQITA